MDSKDCQIAQADLLRFDITHNPTMDTYCTYGSILSYDTCSFGLDFAYLVL